MGIRLRLVLDQLSKETEALQIETEIKQKVQNEMGKTQREYMLRQQLEAIRRELGESEDDEEEVDRLRNEIETAGMPEEALKQATRELERFSQTPSAAAEHAVIRNYLEWMVALPVERVLRGPPRRRRPRAKCSMPTTSGSRRSRIGSSSTSRCSHSSAT